MEWLTFSITESASFSASTLCSTAGPQPETQARTEAVKAVSAMALVAGCMDFLL